MSTLHFTNDRVRVRFPSPGIHRADLVASVSDVRGVFRHTIWSSFLASDTSDAVVEQQRLNRPLLDALTSPRIGTKRGSITSEYRMRLATMQFVRDRVVTPDELAALVMLVRP